MKYIFDFDDVLFKNTEMLKPRIFRLIAETTRIPSKEIEAAYYQLEIRDGFSLIEFIKKFDISEVGANALFERIMEESHNFLNIELVEEIKKIAKNDLFLVTTGTSDWNWSKLKYSGILKYFDTDHIKVTPGKKGDAIKKICEENKQEEVVFIDDKARFIEEIRALHIPNLKTILYTGQKLEL